LRELEVLDNRVIGLLAAQSRSVLISPMERRIYIGAVTGTAVYALALVLNYALGLESLGIILFFIGSLVVGAICRSVKWGSTTSFVLTLLIQVAMALLLSPGVFSDLNIVMAILGVSIINSVIHGVLGAIGALVGQRIFK
jgi:hypothetical protein